MSFPTLEEFAELINSIENESKLVDVLNDAFRAIDPENQILGLESYEKYKSRDMLMRCVFGEVGFNTINWWLYDSVNCATGERRAIWFDDSGHPQEVKTVEELYSYIKEYDLE